ETAQVDEISLNYDFKAQTRMFLVDGSIVDLEVKKTEGGFLFGQSKIYGGLALPTKIIEKINLGGFESDFFKSKFDECLVTPAQEPDKEKKQIQASIVPEEKPSGRKDASGLVIPEKFSNRVKKIGADLYRVGDVTIDSKLQVAAFPAKVNQIVGLIEYALVTDSGKVHESFLSTKIKPGDVHVAMLLLGIKPPGNVSVEIAWQEDGKWTRKSITNCIAQYPLEVASEQEDKETGKSFDLKSSSWTWTGSRVRPSGILVADELGSILSLQQDPDALSLIDPMIDTSRFGSHVWSKKVPKKDSMVQIFIQPFETEKNAKS
ncbi:MAG: YdjY domain-containing protein, partial [Verrucomicrobiota bacterium]|nr:YdjY domain-containing protein [Verrucomicrobiota bacterium]